MARKQLLDKLSIYIPQKALKERPVERLVALGEKRDRLSELPGSRGDSSVPGEGGEVTASRYDQLFATFVNARTRWSTEVDSALRFARSCRNVLVEYYGCSTDRVELLEVEDDGQPGRYKVNQFLESDEKGKCWRFLLRVTLKKDRNPFHFMSFTTEFRLRPAPGGYAIAAGEPQPWHKVAEPAVGELRDLFDSVRGWMMGYLASDDPQYESLDQDVIGFR